MNNELLLLIETHTDTLIEQTRTKPQELLEFRMDNQIQTFFFNLPKNLIEEGKLLLAVTSFEATNSVFNISDENNSFSITIQIHWQTENDEKTISESNKLLEFKSQKGFELHVKEGRKRTNQIKIGDNEYKLSYFDTQKKRDT